MIVWGGDPSGACPKSMRFGPCGGVRNDGGCEVDGHPCPFLDIEVGASPAVDALRLALPHPTIIVDVRAPSRWAGDQELLWHRTAETLVGCVALIGEHVDNPALHDDAGATPPQRVIEILTDAGVPTIATVTGRDRSTESARAMMRSFRDAGVAAIHCVTGDHPASMGIDRPVHFGAESMTLITAAVDEALPVTVGESSASPGPRAERLVAKQAAGAALCILNHGGGSEDLGHFADAAVAAGATLPLIAPVPMVADKRAALGLAGFPGLRLPVGYLDDIIDAVDPESAGMAAAAGLIESLAAGGRFGGINLSGSAGGNDPWERLESTAMFIAIARRGWVG